MIRMRTAVLAVLMMLMVSTSFAWEMTDDNGQMFDIGGQMLYRGRNYNLDFDNDSERSHLNRLNYFGDLSLQFTFRPMDKVTGFFELHKFVFLGQEYRYNTIQTGEAVASEDVLYNLALPDTSIGLKLPLRRNSDEAWEMHLRQAWMDIVMPGPVPLNLKFGRQPFQLGNGIYTNTNISTVFGWQFYTNWGADNVSIRVGGMKFYEGLREDWEEEEAASDRDDSDLYFIDAAKTLQFGAERTAKLGAFVTTFQDYSVGLDKISHYNLGLTGDMSCERGFTLKTEFNYQVGTIEGAGSTGGDVDMSGFSFMANLGIPALLDNKLKLSGEFGMGSGDDPDTIDEFEGYVGVGPFYPYAWAYEYRFLHFIHNSSHFFTKYGSRGMFDNLAPGLENTTYAKATATITLPKVMEMAGNPTFTFSPIYLGLTQEGETFGYEFDNILSVPVYSNFSYQFIFAYVMPSDYMKDRNSDIVDDSWAIRSQLSMTF